ncbi:gliding motility-associated C-terminal domain-containing protein [Hymenobacter sp. BT491]|uniref:T9SS type B sorting domain-containing protein n=1 Tax=Hymenobacter sp. BT491 TaxID=2766779 RepID=UPI001653B3EF|nr:gliding motility-associated C-terminal domain-containing protein [Hymenobacter sp. BT491]MBC6991974.1 gliding motility-associated C-terminal domain-containing protein [Hymenobacter sp. BT491]
MRFVKMYRQFGLLLVVFLWWGTATQAWAQCAPTPNSGACFRAIDVATKQDVGTNLCVGRQVRFVDCSGRALDPKQVYYAKGPAIVCAFTDTATFYTPTTAGVVVVTQNTQNPLLPGTGIVFSRTFQVLTSPEPAFDVNTCTVGLVQVTVTDQTYDQYFVQIGGGPAIAAVRNQTVSYPIPSGDREVTVTGQYNAATLCSNSSTKAFTPLPAPRRPTIQQLTIQGTSINFQFGALQPEYKYELQVAQASGYRTVAQVPSTSNTFTLANAPIPGCYRLLLTDVCPSGNTSITTQLLCTISLTATSVNGRNQLRWTSDGFNNSYEITRNGQSLALVSGSDTQYEDAAVTCGTTYTYRVTAAGFATSTSNEASVQASAGPAPPAPRLLASFNLTNQVELTATPAGNAAGGQVTYLRNAASTTELKTTSDRTLLDTEPTLAAPLCYTARYQDACGSTSTESPAVCPVILQAQAANPDVSAVNLTWSGFRGPDAAQPVSYRLLTLAADNSVLSTRSVQGTTTLDQQLPANQPIVRYRLEASSNGIISYSNIATVPRRIALAMPTAFTPNGDGLNDVLEVKGRFLTSFQFIVIDRNGQEVFRGTNPTQTWDGRVNGQPPVPGTYVWHFEALDPTGKPFVQNGTVNVLR